VPKEYIKPIDPGVQGALELGILAGYPIVDVKVTLYDGSYHEMGSNEMAFKFAGSIAFKEAARKASPVLLEPVMAVEVTVARGVHGRDHRRHQLAPRAHREHGTYRWIPSHQGDCATSRTVAFECPWTASIRNALCRP
jgi:hypothetical protein